MFYVFATYLRLLLKRIKQSMFEKLHTKEKELKNNIKRKKVILLTE